MAKIDSVYEYYLTTYGASRSEVSRYDSHKKSELRKVYNSIVQSNKESPLYKLTDPEGAKRYAIDIKEQAKTIQNVVASLSDTNGLESAFQKKVAISSNEDVVTAQYIGDGSEEITAEQFNIEVKELAAPQVNVGNYLSSDIQTISPGTYTFDLATSKATYEFQYNVNPEDSNKDVQGKLARLVNKANLGIKAEILEDGAGKSALMLTSKQTGLAEGEDFLFKITPSSYTESSRAMDILGIDNTTVEAHNSTFYLNGAERNSFSNTFSINKTFELTLQGPSPEGEIAQVGFKANVDAVADNINTLVQAYNNILDIAANYRDQNSDVKSPTLEHSRLYRDMSSIGFSNATELNGIGLTVEDDGKIQIDLDTLEEAIQPGRMEGTLAILDKLRDSIGSKAEKAAINPMNYVNKVVVAYKNPGKNFATPYVSSIYSGMILDSAI